MRCGWLLSLGVLLALTGCGPAAYWTESCGDCRVTLRDGGETGTLELVLASPAGETVLRTLTAPADRVSAQPFTDVLGYTGFRLTERQGLAVRDPAEDWSLRTYYAVEDGAAVRIAESFGWGAPQDYAVDLDGDGSPELVSNVTYGGDGHQEAYIYQRREDGIWRGQHDLTDLPGHEDRGVNSTAVSYDAEREIFQIRYTVRGEPGFALLEAHGLERVEFTPYEKDEK